MTDVTPQRLLQATADYYKTHNWCGQGPRDDAGGECLVVAMVRCYQQMGVSPADAVKLCHTAWDIFERVNGTPHGLIQWNETPGRTKEQVITALEKAAAT